MLSEVKAEALEGALAGGAAVTLAGNRLPFSINLDLGGISLPKTLQLIGAGNALTGGVAPEVAPTPPPPRTTPRDEAVGIIRDLFNRRR